MKTQDRAALIARLRDYTYEGDPRHLMEAAAAMLEADGKAQQQEPTGKQSLQVAKHRTTGWMAPVGRYAVPVLFNPYTGEPRDVRDVASDPHGILIVPPGKVEMLAARQYPADMPNGDAQPKNGGLSLQPAVPQEPVKTKEQATAFIESKLWEAIDMHGAFPNALIDSRTWEHLSCYAPLPKPQPQRPRLSDEEIEVIAKETQSAEPGRDGYILPFLFARAIERKVRGEA